MKKKETWTGLVELKPKPGDRRLGGGKFGTAGGAFTHAFAVAGSRGEFREKVRTALGGMRYRLVGIQDVEPVATRMKAARVPRVLLMLAKKAEGGGTVEFGDFYMYPETHRLPNDRIVSSLARTARVNQLIYVGVASGDGAVGALVGVGRQLLLLQRLDSDAMTFTGYTAIPLREILSWRPLTDFRVSALDSLGVRPSPLADAPLDDLKKLLAWANDQYGLIAIFRERIRADASWVGRIQELTDKGVVMKLVGRKANWVGEYRVWLKAVTRVDFGGAYERLLASAVDKRLTARTKRQSGTRRAR